MSREIADIIPAVTVPPNPRGLPIAIDQSPTLIASESPHSTETSFVEPGFIFRITGGRLYFLEFMYKKLLW